MKINEVEELLNTPRANIRYYEKEGLINVSRKENGYRNYTEEDIARLKKIIIFRKLGISVDKIKDLLNGDAELSQILDESIVELEKQIEELKGAIEVSKEIKDNGVCAEELDETYYWNLINEKENNGKGFPDTWQDFLGAELNIFDTMWKRVFFLDFKKYRDRLGWKKAFIFIFVILIIRGLSEKFIWHESFWEGFLYPIGLFLTVSIIFLPIFLIGKKYPKVGSTMMTVIYFLSIAILVCIFLLLGIGVIKGLFFN